VSLSAHTAGGNPVAHTEGCGGKHYRADCPNGLAAAIRAKHWRCNTC